MKGELACTGRPAEQPASPINRPLGGLEPRPMSPMRICTIEQLGGALRDSEFYYEIYGFAGFLSYVHLGKFGSMEDTPTRCGGDLPTIPGIFKN